MKKIACFVCIMFLLSGVALAGNVKITAIEIGPQLRRIDFELAYKAIGSKVRYKNKVLYISKYQVIGVEIENNSDSVVNVNPNYFTLVSNMKASYAYSSETHGFKDKVQFVSKSPVQAVDVYPGTITEGFLLFERKYEDERPKKLYFKNLQAHIGVDVLLDPKVKK